MGLFHEYFVCVCPIPQLFIMRTVKNNQNVETVVPGASIAFDPVVISIQYFVLFDSCTLFHYNQTQGLLTYTMEKSHSGNHRAYAKKKMGLGFNIQKPSQ